MKTPYKAPRHLPPKAAFACLGVVAVGIIAVSPGWSLIERAVGSLYVLALAWGCMPKSAKTAKDAE